MRNYPLTRYVLSLKTDQRSCEVCTKKLERAYLLLDDMKFDKKSILAMNARISYEEWKALRSRIRVVCRFCSIISEKANIKYFDIPAFKYYLTVETKLKESSILEYSRRLKSLQTIFEKNNAKFKLAYPTKAEFLKQYKCVVTGAMFKAYSRVIDMYIEYENGKSESK